MLSCQPLSLWHCQLSLRAFFSFQGTSESCPNLLHQHRCRRHPQSGPDLRSHFRSQRYISSTKLGVLRGFLVSLLQGSPSRELGRTHCHCRCSHPCLSLKCDPKPFYRRVSDCCVPSSIWPYRSTLLCWRARSSRSRPALRWSCSLRCSSTSAGC